MKNSAKKILIIEDEAPLAKAMALKLDHSGFDTATALDGETALEMLKKQTFDLIILDLIMAEIDGFSILAELKNRNNTIPVIVASNLGQEEDIKRAKDLGACDYLIKSNISLNDIVTTIKKILKI